MTTSTRDGVQQLPLSITLDQEMTRENWLPRAETSSLEAWLFSSTGSAFIGSDAGLGKSHLLQALCRETDGSLYLPLASVLDMPPMALLEGGEGASLLALDGLEALAQNRQWQEALFHLFNRALHAGTRMVIAGRGLPSAVPGLLPDLRSRVESLPPFALPRFTEEALDGLLAFRGERRGLRLNPDVRGYLLRRSGRSPRDLMAIIEELDRGSLALGRAITIPLLRELNLPSQLR